MIIKVEQISGISLFFHLAFISLKCLSRLYGTGSPKPPYMIQKLLNYNPFVYCLLVIRKKNSFYCLNQKDKRDFVKYFVFGGLICSIHFDYFQHYHERLHFTNVCHELSSTISFGANFEVTLVPLTKK